tara:strand:- start:2915 stop:3280 length:366 start_codon:yes stop_codon:yes gene_type:complete
MKEDIQKELMWAFGALTVFILFLVYGELSVNEMLIPIVAFVVNWIVISYFIKNYGLDGDSTQNLENEFKWYSAMLILFVAIMTFIGISDDELELTPSLFGTLVFGFTFVWVIRSSAMKYFS